ncbi:MAG: hypothetical protein NZO16_00980 [Deltaproteobacteria bacterium]|nr:hypothetical protein [Deltaproteobacteria bacterium]
MRRKKTVIFFTILLVTVFAVSSIGVTFLEPTEKKDYGLIFLGDSEVMTTSEFREYLSVFVKGNISSEQTDQVTPLLDFISRVEVLKDQNLRGSQLVANQLYSKLFENANPQYVLASLGVSSETLSRVLRDLALSYSIEKAFVDFGFLSDILLERAIKILRKKYFMKIYSIKPTNLDVEEVSQSDIEEYYEKNLSQFTTPETFSGEFGVVRLEVLESVFPVSDEVLEEFYLKKKATFKEEDLIKCEIMNFLVKDLDLVRRLTENSWEQFKLEISNLNLKPIVSSRVYTHAEFKELFEDSPKNQKIYGPVVTSSGATVCFVTEIKVGSEQPFDQIRPIVKKRYMLEETVRFLKDLAQDVSESNFREFVEKYGLQTEQVFSDIVGYELQSKTLKTVRLEEGLHFYQAVDPETGEVHLRFVFIREKKEPKPKVLDDVKSDIISIIQAERQNAKARELIAKVVSEKNETVLAQLNASVEEIMDTTVLESLWLLDLPQEPGFYGPFEGEAEFRLVKIERIEEANDFEANNSVVDKNLREALRTVLNTLPLDEIIESGKYSRVQVLTENLKYVSEY